MFSSFLQLAVGSSDLSQAEKEISLSKAEQIHKMSTIFTQKMTIFFIQDYFELPFCEFAQICKQLFISQLDINPVIQEPTETK